MHGNGCSALPEVSPSNKKDQKATHEQWRYVRSEDNVAA